MSIINSRIHAFSNCAQVLVAWKYEQHFPNCVGFAIFRKCGDEPDALAVPQANNVGYLDLGNRGEGTKLSTYHPIQDFIWFDHSVQENEVVSYMVVPVLKVLNGFQNDRHNASKWTNRVTLSSEHDLSCFFNKVSLSVFDNKLDEEYRGGHLHQVIVKKLREAEADGKTNVFAVVLDVDHPDILKSFKGLGSRLKVLTTKETHDESLKECSGVGLLNNLKQINNYIVFSDGETTKVWIGSTFTRKSLSSQISHGILFNDDALGEIYLKEWERLAKASGEPIGKTTREGVSTWVGIADSDNVFQLIKDLISKKATRNVLFLMSDDNTQNSIYRNLKNDLKSLKKRISVKGVIVPSNSGEDFVFDDGDKRKVKGRPKLSIGSGDFVIVADAFDENPVVIVGSYTESLFINPLVIEGKTTLAVHFAINILSIYASLVQRRDGSLSDQWFDNYYRDPNVQADLEFVLGPGYPRNAEKDFRKQVKPMWIDKQEWSQEEKKAWDEQKEFMKSIRVGSADRSGNMISRVITRADEYVIYEIQTSILSDSIKVSIVSIVEMDMFLIERFDAIRVSLSKIKGQLFKVNDDVSYKGRIGHIISHALSSGDTEASNKEFDKLEKEIDFIYVERFQNSLKYLATIMTFSALLASLAISAYLNDWFVVSHPLLRTLIFTASSGSLGGFLSTSRRLRTMSFEKEIPTFAYIFYGLERVTVSVCGAFIVLLAVKSGLGGVIIKEGMTGIMILAVVAGFSETLIPNILVKIEADQSEKKK